MHHRPCEQAQSQRDRFEEGIVGPDHDSRSPLVPLDIFVSGPRELASTTAVEIIGLPGGWVLSMGRSLGDRWRIPTARLSGAAILPPLHFSGAVDLEVELRLANDTLVERRSVRRAMTDPDLATEETVLPLGKRERDRSGARPDARVTLEKFRMDFQRHRNERSFADLVSELRAASSEFRRWWASPLVHSTGDGVKTFWSKDGKAVEYSYCVLTLSAKQSQRLVVFMPLKEAHPKNGVSYAAQPSGGGSA